MMRCDTCKAESPVVMRVVIAKEYDRSLAHPLFNCPACFEKKEASKRARAAVRQTGRKPPRVSRGG